MWKAYSTFFAALILLTLCGMATAQDMDLQIELMGPIGTKVSHRGDRVYGRIVQPDSLKGDMVEGSVKDVHAGGKLRGGSVLSFSFDTLQHAGQSISMTTQIKSFQNSRGQADVDEEGRLVRGGDNRGKAVAGTAAGSLIGGIAGGWKGAVIGTASGAAASIAVIEITADSPEIRFNPGSIVTVSASTHGGTALTALVAGGSTTAAPSASAGTAAASATSSATAAASTSVPTGAPATSQPGFVALKDDFVPGEKMLFYDDFMDMAPGEASRHWKVRGGALSVKEGGGIRQATPVEKNKMTPLLKSIPKNFSLEMDVKYDKPSDSRVNWSFRDKDDREVLNLSSFAYDNHTFRLLATHGDENLADSTFPCEFNEPITLNIWIQDGRLRYYLNGVRILDANQIELPAIQTAVLETLPGDEGASVNYRRVRIAESMPDFSHTILSSGRYVTYGILFDTDSDHLKPESAGVIKTIASGMRANPSLKLRIEGHTDASGTAAHNLELSGRRAEAVKAVLVSQFQIDSSRLTTEGMGSTKPVASNDDPAGRSQNRRVEFVKL